MKILFHINSMGHGGAERVVSVLAKEFTTLGHEVLVATLWQAESEYPLPFEVERQNVGLDELDENKGRISKIILRYSKLRKYVRSVKPDIVISFCNKANFRSSVALMGMRIPLIVSVRNDPVRDYAPYKAATAIMERKAAGCVFQTPDAREFFSKKLRNKSRIIVNPLSDKYVACDYRYNALKWNEGREKTIISVGRISDQKNHILLVKAFKEIAEQVPEAKIRIYGDFQEGSCTTKLKALINEYNLNERVLLCGLSEDVISRLKEAYLFVLSSDYEGMPNALLEAMSVGLPCISTDCPCGGSRMLFEMDNEGGSRGILVPVNDTKALADSMLKLLKNADVANEYAKKSLEIKEYVKPQVIASMWLGYIESVINK